MGWGECAWGGKEDSLRARRLSFVNGSLRLGRDDSVGWRRCVGSSFGVSERGGKWCDGQDTRVLPYGKRQRPAGRGVPARLTAGG